MKALLTLMLTFLSGSCAALEKIPSRKLLKVAVIDTGIWSGYTKNLCQEGHKDFTGQGIQDVHGHGTHIVDTINNYARNTNYCIVILKFYHDDKVSIKNKSADDLLSALKYAITLKPDIINISAGGPEYVHEEKKFVRLYLDMGGILVAAAGNNKADLSEKPYYPASYDDRIKVVGNCSYFGRYYGDAKCFTKTISSYSNYGSKVRYWEYGEDIEARCGKNKICKMSGTSQAAAIWTGKYLHTYKVKK